MRRADQTAPVGRDRRVGVRRGGRASSADSACALRARVRGGGGATGRTACSRGIRCAVRTYFTSQNGSFTATTLAPSFSQAARQTSRPMRPKPEIPMLTMLAEETLVALQSIRARSTQSAGRINPPVPRRRRRVGGRRHLAFSCEV